MPSGNRYHLKIRKCEVCDKQIKMDERGLPHYCPASKHSYEHRYCDYNNIASEDIMVCSECCSKNDDKISIKEYISEKQSRDYVLLKLKEGVKVS